MAAMCPQCGFDLERDDVIERGPIRFDPRGEVRWNGLPVRLNPTERIVLGTLLKADGRFLKAEAICERIGYEGDDPSNMVAVYVSRLRTRFGRAAVETMHGMGRRWAA